MVQKVLTLQKTYYNVYKESLSEIEVLNKLKYNISVYCVKRKEHNTNRRGFNKRDYPEIVPEVLAKNVTAPDEFTSEFVKLMKERSLN